MFKHCKFITEENEISYTKHKARKMYLRMKFSNMHVDDQTAIVRMKYISVIHF